MAKVQSIKGCLILIKSVLIRVLLLDQCMHVWSCHTSICCLFVFVLFCFVLFWEEGWVMYEAGANIILRQGYLTICFVSCCFILIAVVLFTYKPSF